MVKEKANKRKFRSFMAALLAFVLAFMPVLSSLPAIQAEAADSKVWYHVEAGSGNENGHSYSQASTKPAAVLLHKTARMQALGGTFSVTYEKQGTPSNARLGFFYTYVDDNNFLYVGTNPSGDWYYEYNVNGESSYSSMDDLPSQSDGARTTISVSLSRETLVVNVNDTEAKITNQALIPLTEEGTATEGRVGFRAGNYSTNSHVTSFHFTDATLNGQALSGDWEFLAECEGQVFEQEEEIPLYTVTGQVVSAKDNAPIEDALVRVGEESARTDASGNFSVNVEAGTYDVSASASGYTAYTASGVAVAGDMTLETIRLTEKEAGVYDTFIEKDDIKAAVSETFPQVMQYQLKTGNGEKTVAGQETELTTIKINGTSITPVMGAVKINADSAVYPMTLVNAAASIDMEMTVKISVSENDLTWEVTDITKHEGCAKINKIEVPNLNLVTITASQADAEFMGANLSGNTTSIGDVRVTFESGFQANASTGYAYGFLSADGVSAGVWSNSEMAGDKRLLLNNGVDSMSLTSNVWYYEYGDLADSANYDGTPYSELPSVKVCLAADENEDGTVDWQDGAIAYRDIMNNPYGYEEMKDMVNYRIVMNFSSQATNPFLKTADNIKKVYLATDGLGQAVMLKGYGSEGHDSANSEYGNIGERIGGAEDLKALNEIAHQYDTQVGIHVNAQEVYPEAQSFTDELINGPSSLGWGWLDQSYSINRPYDLGSGLRYKRFLQLYDQLNGTSLYANAWPGVAGQSDNETVADADTIAATVEEHLNNTENLDFIYLDVWYGDAWETRRIAEQVNSLGWRFSTEFGTTGEYDSTWQHWATEGSYGGSSSKGVNSDVIRFIRNHQKDSFVLNWPSYGGTADNPLLGGYDLGGFEGWGSNNNFDTYLTKTFAINLPTKFLQHYEVVKWENYADGESPVGNHEKEITLKNEAGDTVVVTRNEEQRSDDYVERTITLNGKKVLDDVTYLLPWTDSETNEVKLYHYNYDGGTTTWELPGDWANLANVKVYKLTDTGRTEEQTVSVSGGQVTLTAEADTPYIVLKGAEAPKTVSEWSNKAHVVDSGFNSYAGTDDGTALNSSVWTANSEDIKVVRVVSGNKYLRMGSADGTQTASTTLTDLVPGENYVAQVYVDNKSEAKAWIKVTGAEEDVSNYTLKSLANNWVRCDAHNVNAVSDSKMQTMQVCFTAKAATATLTLEREAGEGFTYFDDIRIINKTLNNIQADGSFVQDFETVVNGLYPFVMGPAQGVDDQVTHLSEKNEPYTQSGWGNVILDDVIDGNWSLKHHGSNNGIIYQTIPQNLHLEPGVVYDISFDYQAGCADSYYMVIGDGDDIVEELHTLQKTAASSVGEKSTTERYSFQITGSESGQSWFGLASSGASESGSYGQKDFILDNLKVSKAAMTIDKTYVEATTAQDKISLNISYIEEPVEKPEIIWTSSNEDVARVTSTGDVYFVGFGTATITATAVVNGREVSQICIVDMAEEYAKTATFKNVWYNTQETSGEDGAAVNVTDRNAGTIWHSNWSTGFTVSESNPAIITLQIEEDISEFTNRALVQRSGNNGLVQKYEIIVGEGYDEATQTITGQTYASGTVTATNSTSGTTETLNIPEGTNGHYIQIRVLQGSNSFASIADIMLDTVISNDSEEERAYMEANLQTVERIELENAKKGLTASVAKAEAVYAKGQDKYTAESWKAFEAAYKAAKEAQSDASKSTAELKALAKALADAQKALKTEGEKEDEVLAAAKKALDAALKAADAVYAAGGSAYTAESWKAFTDTYTAAKNAAANADAAALKALAAALTKAQCGLVKAAAPADALKKGDTVIVKKVLYKVTNASKKTVTAVKGTNKKATSAVIAATVKVKGVTCKVTAVNAKAFKGYAKLKKVTVGKNVATIGKQAFYGCKKLTKVTFKGTAVKAVKSGAFKKTNAKIKVTLPKKLKGKKRTKVVKLLKKAGIKSAK